MHLSIYQFFSASIHLYLLVFRYLSFYLSNISIYFIDISLFIIFLYSFLYISMSYIFFSIMESTYCPYTLVPLNVISPQPLSLLLYLFLMFNLSIAIYLLSFIPLLFYLISPPFYLWVYSYFTIFFLFSPGLFFSLETLISPSFSPCDPSNYWFISPSLYVNYVSV